MPHWLILYLGNFKGERSGMLKGGGGARLTQGGGGGGGGGRPPPNTTLSMCNCKFVIIQTKRVRCDLNKEILDLLNEESISGVHSGRTNL